MGQQALSIRRRVAARVALLAVVAAGSLAFSGLTAGTAAAGDASATVLQTNMVADLPGVAAVADPHLVNPWGISESAASPFWISDNNAGVATLYGGSDGSVAALSLVVTIPTPVSPFGGGTPTGTVFNLGLGAKAFLVSGVDKTGAAASAPAIFLFATEDGTITGWNPGVNPRGFDLAKAGTYAVVAVDSSGNNFTNPDPGQQTGAVYKGLAIATSSSPIVTGDAASTALLYASNFRAGTVDVYDANFNKVSTLAAGAFTDNDMPDGFAPFNVQVLNGKVFVTYARQNKTRHDDLAAPNRGFVDVFNLDGTPGLAGGAMRLISRDELDSPWGLAIAPSGFAGIGGALLVGNFGDGLIHAYDATTGAALGKLTDPDGEPIQIDGLWGLKVGNGGNGGSTNTVYFTAGLFGESHGLFGALTAVAAGSPEGPAERQWVQANIDLVQLDQAQLEIDLASGAPAATIRHDTQTLDKDSHALAALQRAFADDSVDDATS